MRLLRALTSHPVEVVSGLVLVGVGVVLTLAGTAPSAKSPAKDIIIGAVAAAFGGILMSWTAGKVLSRAEALEDIRAQLDLVSRNLGQASGQISRAVEQAQTSELQPSTGFALVAQAATMIYGQVSAIQTILGDRFDAEDLLFTVKELESLAVRLERRTPGTDDEVDAVRSRLQEMRSQLARTTSTGLRTREVTACPYCHSQVAVMIGLNGGDSASAMCQQCGRRFNAHRRSDGTIFERGLGAVTAASAKHVEQPLALTGSCPTCGNEISIQPSSAPAGGEVKAACVCCGTKVVFELDTRKIHSAGSMDKVPGLIVGKFGSGAGRPVVECDKCGQTLRCVARRNGAYYAFDNVCDRLYEVKNPDFEEWRNRTGDLQHQSSAVLDGQSRSLHFEGDSK